MNLYISFIARNTAEFEKYAYVFGDDATVDLYEYLNKHAVAQVIFSTDDAEELHPNRKVKLHSFKINNECVFLPRFRGDEAILWADKIIPMLCKTFGTDEFNSFVEVELSFEHLKELGLV